jgi:N-6 DNA methylase
MTKVMRTKNKVEFGDFQTPRELTEEISKALFEMGIKPKIIIEPTCGEGNFLIAAIKQFPSFDKAVGFDINLNYVEATKNNLQDAKHAEKVSVEVGDFFTIDWKKKLDILPSPILVIGNPPWVTNSRLGLIGSTNLPEKSNFQKHNGLLAMTGKSNFDISEWMLLKMLDWLNDKNGTLAMLCKKSVARKVLAYAWKHEYQLSESRIYLIDALRHFDATVDACLLVCSFKPNIRETKCKQFSSLKENSPTSEIGYKSGLLIAKINYYNKWKHLFGSSLQWRSGIKHDCSKVMELYKEGEHFRNGLDEKVLLEDLFLYPMLKSSELVNGKHPTRWMIVTQKSIGEDTSTINDKAPKTWKYLNDHREYFSKRGSSIYKNKPQFSIFGVGGYSFSPWKVAISALYKKLEFNIVGSLENKPIVLDDTQNFLPCESSEEAKHIIELLNSKIAKEFYKSFIFWDEKRPITISLLKYLDFNKLIDITSKSQLEDSLQENAWQRPEQLTSPYIDPDFIQ